MYINIYFENSMLTSSQVRQTNQHTIIVEAIRAVAEVRNLPRGYQHGLGCLVCTSVYTPNWGAALKESLFWPKMTHFSALKAPKIKRNVKMRHFDAAGNYFLKNISGLV